MQIFGCAFLMIMLLSNPAACSEAAFNALKIWGLDVVPSLFPYMVLCRLLAERLQKKNMPVSFSVPLLGLCGGSPSGAAALSSYMAASPLRKRTVYALLTLTGGISPAFFLQTLTRWGIPKGVAGRLLLIHIAGAALSAVIVFCISGDNEVLLPGNSNENKDENPITQAVQGVLGIGGCIVFFSVASRSLILCFPALDGTAAGAFLHACLEIAGGIHDMTRTVEPLRDLRLMISAAAGFSGISILLQNFIQIRGSGVSFSRVLMHSILRGAVCWMLALFVFRY